MKKLSYLLCAVLLVCSSNVFASTITVSDVVSSWQNSIPPAPPIIISNGDPTSTASWGTSTGFGPSSYVFTHTIPPDVSVVVPPSPSALFKLGNFTHNNNTIDAPFLESIDLSLALNFTIDSNPFNETFIYTFDHNETSNSSDPVASQDIVTIIPPSSGTSFSVDGVLYTLELSFLLDNSPTNQFRTFENQANEAAIFGRFISETETNPIPEPISMILFGTGSMLIGGFIRSRSKKR
jgi:hypothetical protein